MCGTSTFGWRPPGELTGGVARCVQEGYEVAVFEGLNGMHSAKAQLLLGVPAENPEWAAVLQTLTSSA